MYKAAGLMLTLVVNVDSRPANEERIYEHC